LAGGCGGETGQEKSRSEWRKKKTINNAENAEDAEKNKKNPLIPIAVSQPAAAPATLNKKKSKTAAISALKALDLDETVKDRLTQDGAIKRPMPSTIHPMLATPVDEPFDGPDWLFEIKWDGYRAVAFIEEGRVRLVSRNQNDLTARYPELKDLPQFIKAKTAILDGEVVALDDQGRPSFSLMQQRTGFRPGGRRTVAKADVPVLYYIFDLLYLDGYDLRRVALEERKRKLASLITPCDSVRYSDHYEEQGKALFDMARQKGLEGILAKRRDSAYHEQRTREWLKIKITHRLECVIGGYTEPEGTRAHFGSIVLGLYDKKKNLIHVGQAGSGFDQKSLGEVWKLLQKLATKQNPFHGKVEALRKVDWVKPELVAEIEFAEWTEGANSGSGPKLRAPVFLGLRDDKDPSECTLEDRQTIVAT
jgi:bifunctional non-homologous end joining protein LigD